MVALANLVTGVKGNAEGSYRNGNVNLTPANIGAVNKAGDTMSGNLNINRAAASDESVRFGTTAGQSSDFISINQNDWGIMYYVLPVKKVSDGTLRLARFSFYEYSPNSDGTRSANAEIYNLPNVDVGRTSDGRYDILTSKNAVTVDQGGTGATTAPMARENLNAAACIRLNSSDNTPEKLLAQLSLLSVGETALVHAAGSALNMLTGKTIGLATSGMVFRNSTNEFYFDLTRNNGQTRWAFGTTITATVITPGTVYQYQGTAMS